LGITGSAPRRKREGLAPESFARLLDWLDPDRDRAGEKYELIRLRLIKIFVCRGCSAAEELTDETFDRVTGKLSEIAEGYVGDPALYFYGVAEKVYLEHGKRAGLQVPMPDDVAQQNQPSDTAEKRYGCLDQCMQVLSEPNRKLILLYYGHDSGKDKISKRKELAQKWGIGANALWIRAHRIRESLKQCVSDCLQRQQSVCSKRN